MKHEKSCGAVVRGNFDGEWKILLIRHVNGGHWASPKGHVEAGENEEETALREIREETGLNVTLDTGFRHTVSYSPAEGIEKEVVYFLAESKERTLLLQAKEILGAGWFSIDEAKQKATYENDRQILALAEAYLREHNPAAGRL